MIEKKLSNATPLDDENVVLRRSDKKELANVSLSNLSEAGQAKFDAKANVDLSNLSEAGQAKFDAKANVDLSNLTSVGIDKINQSKALETGSVSSDADVYADIQKYAHSTFDKSKFEVVGSPTITEDGVASGFSNNDYIKSNYEFDLTKSWETRITFQTPNSNLQYSSGIGQFDGNLNNNSLFIRTDYKLTANFKSGVNLDLISNVIMEKNTKYTAVIGWDLRNYYLKILDHTCKLIDTIKSENNAPLDISDSKRKYRIGKIFDFTDGRYKFQGSIDLKSFSIWADGIPVFNGNQTGLDIIKPDEYTVIRTPSISETGIVTNIGNGNKIQCNTFTLADLKGKSWRVECEINVADLNTSDTANFNTYLLKFCNNWYSYGSITCVYYNELNRFNFRLNIRVDDYEGWHCYTTIPILTEDIKRLKIIATFDKDAETQNYKLKVFNADTGEQLGNTGVYTPTTDKKELDIIDDLPTQSPLLGDSTTNWTTYDLNTYKFYIEDKLVWQPCLKIPYTLSKTGSKIVDAAYRDRVQDVYEQYGYAPYYTIDEENENFTLPMGEIYGMIERKNNELNNPFSLFDYKYTDAPIYNASWLKADGTFYAKSVYVSAYEALVVENNSDITAGTTTTLPSGGSYTKRGLSVKLSTASYTDTDFVINTTDETFRLPLTTKAVPFAGGSFPVVGTGIALGLTNARDSRVLTLQSNSDGAEINVNGGGQTLPYNAGGINRPENGYVMGLSKDSSKSGVVANVSGTTGLNLYFYVGETVQNAYLIDAGQIAGQIAENMDGSWTKKLLVLENNTTIATDSTGKLYDLSDYLPEDNNVYEILFAAAIRTGAQTNSYMAISQQVGSSYGVLANGITRTNSYLETGGSAIGIIMSDRKLQMAWTATVSSGTLLYLRILAYRKVR